ncbi:hypothetical protein BV25DRAFT_1974145 [Artomyces pyxidatus]|uniref:Uncharacterized protein n=1 Tax=Artomyces pyxidatus TaxID=48021 RepID=A0ACB8SMT9_9AGAM|nr:hypothetical protein BV25DRAFT_1974145 [Artomyces pyxidatus]
MAPSTAMRRLYINEFKSQGVMIKEICGCCFRYLHSSHHALPHIGTMKVLPKNITSLRRCKACKVAFYCSKECQIRDWAKHGPACREITTEAVKGEAEMQRTHAFNNSVCSALPTLGAAANSAVHFTPPTTNGAKALSYPGPGFRALTPCPRTGHYAFLVFADAAPNYELHEVLPPGVQREYVFYAADARYASQDDIRSALLDVLLAPEAFEPADGIDAELHTLEGDLRDASKINSGKIPSLIIDKGARYPNNVCIVYTEVGEVNGVEENWLEAFRNTVW